MSDLIWLASYPKSGNTWTRAFLTHYLGEEEDEFDINHLASGPISSNRALFDQTVGIEASCLLPDEIDNMRAAAFRQLASERKSALFIKTHEAWRRAPNGEQIFPSDVSRGVVYIVRNPLDVVLSSAHHYASSVEDCVAHLNDEAFTLSRVDGDIGHQLIQPLGSWSSHVRSWLDESGLATCVLRYEEMLADPVAAFGGLVRFAGLAYDQGKVAAAAQATSFEELRRQESDLGFRERPRRASAPFFRQGRAGVWREQLPPNLVTTVVSVHGEIMHRLGYLDSQGNLLL